MDKFTVWADKLSIPASFTFYNGGVIVFEGHKTVFLKDSTGEGKANYHKEMFGYWNQNDTHGGVSNMRYGLDNWIWAMQGYNNSKVKVGGEDHQFKQGFFRFKPDGSKLEFLRSTNNNTWGLGISEEGLIFGSTANGNPSTHMAIPNRYYESVKGWKVSGLEKNGIAGNPPFFPITDKVRQVDYFGRYTAAAGHALYTARNYPQEYWNRTAFVSEPTGHLVGTFDIHREGAHFKSTNKFNLVASDDEWTSPIFADVGPDGNVWIIDWYSFIVQHNPTPPGFKTGKGAAYFTDLRNSKFGRIYRIVPENFKARQPPMTLKDATPEKLVATLKHPTMFWRLHAQRLLVERGKQDVVPALVKLVQDQSTDEIGLNVGAIHALWTLHGLGALANADGEPAKAAIAAIKHPSAGVRRNAVQVVSTSPQTDGTVLGAGVLDDAHPHVRLAAFLALADLPASPKAGQALVEALAKATNANDKFLLDAVTAAAAKNSEHFLIALTAQKKPNAPTLNIAGIVAEHYARGGPVNSINNVMAKLADAADLDVVEQVARGLARGWPSKVQPKLDDALEKSLAKLASRLPTAQRFSVASLATGWGSKQFEKAVAEIAAALLAKVKDEKLADNERTSAARELVAQTATDKPMADKLIALIEPRTPPDLAKGIIAALQSSEVPEVGQSITDHMAGWTPQVRGAAISVLLAKPDWTRIYLDRVEKGKLQLTELSLDQKQALSSHPNSEVRTLALELFKKGGVLPNADREAVIQSLLSITKEKGDPAAGKVVFTNTCSKCHVHSGIGTAIGPDLTGMAVHSKEHLLVEIMDPSRSVEGNFRIYTVVTNKGLVLNGLLAAESKTSIDLYDSEGKKQTILTEDIESLTASNKSLMPDGFEKQLDRKQLADLLEFLTQRGKYLPLPLDRAATVVSTKGMFNSLDSTAERLVMKEWGPKTVKDVPFQLIDPHGDKVPNMIMLYSPQGKVPPTMPKSVKLPYNGPAKAIHLLSGVSGWGYPYGNSKEVVMTVRLHYADGKTEDHALKNGVHFADYISRQDVPGSEFAFLLRNQQMRYLAVQPQRDETITEIELIKGPDPSAPVVMAVTVESRS
jgi:putative membrane-bound dehydrogenase-like protein